jgi:RNA polymerase sporulation-specific sigma factor
MDHLFLMGILAGIIIFALHVTAANSFPKPLAKDEESKYFEEMKKGSKEARNKLIEHNLRLVAHIIKKYYSNSSEQDDLISIGTIGLIKAVNTFCPEKNIKLATYASRCIENEILMYLRKNSARSGEISIDKPLNVDWDGNELLLSDVLGSDNEDIGKSIEQEDEKRLLMGLISGLPNREKRIMEMRFGLSGYQELTQKEVADLLGISQSYISRLEKRIINKLKKQFEKSI